MMEMLLDMLDLVPARCSYAEIRHVVSEREDILVRNRGVDQIERESIDGIGVRVRVGGGWGFAATRDASRTGAERALCRALAIAESQPVASGAPLTPTEPARGHWSGPF